MWPDHAKYSDAIQSPSRCFLDAELKACSVATNRLGLPKPSSGQFAVAFELHGASVFAVKCFTQQVHDQQTRYEAIAKHISGRQMPFLVGFSYLDQGIRVDGHWFPIVKMEWAGGELLSQYVGSNVDQPAVLRRLANEWRGVVGSLRRGSMAHGDLQNGNIKVVGGKIRLIDYDGMYVPTLRGQAPGEIGVRHFQHPWRASGDFGPEIDNFSALVIHLSLLAVAAEPALWADFFQDENLVLTQSDFKAPGQTPTWSRLQASPDPEVRRLATLLDGVCRGSVADVPDLDAVLRGQPSAANPRAAASIQQTLTSAISTPWYLAEPAATTPAISSAESTPGAPWYRQHVLEVAAEGSAANGTAQPITLPSEVGSSPYLQMIQAVIAATAILVIANWVGMLSLAWPGQGQTARSGLLSEGASERLAQTNEVAETVQHPIAAEPAVGEVNQGGPLEPSYYWAEAAAWEGGWYRGDGEWYGRPWVALYGQNSEYPSAWLFMQIDVPPVGPATLYLEGLDDDWAGTNRIEVEVNGVTIFVGPNPFPNWDGIVPGAGAAWGQRSFDIPEGLLTAGRNSVVVTNLEPAANYSMPPYVLIGELVLEIQSYAR
jgi:hypothetical protein